MKKILIVAAVILASSCLLFATGHGRAKVGPEKFGKDENIKHPGIKQGIYERLNLTEEQRTKIQGIFKNSRDQIHALKEDTTLDPEQKKAKVREIFQSAHQQAEAILTPDQKQKLEEMKEKMREKMKERREKMKKERGENKPTE